MEGQVVDMKRKFVNLKVLLILALFLMASIIQLSSLIVSCYDVELKPGVPVMINENDIQVGEEKAYVCSLKKGVNYHIYLYGEWTKPGQAENLTDYDIYVYDPYGRRVSNHTEAAGLPENVRTRDSGSYFFTPKYSGKYRFVVRNDNKESQSAKAATFIIIENIKTNRWYQLYMEGKRDDKETFYTSWSYEFITSSSRIEVYVKVPDSLDMYEARLYIMANPSQDVGSLLKGIPIAWEPGLYGETLKKGPVTYGGYSLSSKGYRNYEAFASCEDYGRDMLINYTSPLSGETLYHLLFIAERGKGNISFMVKTDFVPPNLTLISPPEISYPTIKTAIIARITDLGSGVGKVVLNYTTNNWQDWNMSEMVPYSNDTFIAYIPKMPAGVTVNYKVAAFDKAENNASSEGSFLVKKKTDINIKVSNILPKGGEKIAVIGKISNCNYTVTLTLNYTHKKENVTRTIKTYPNGSFIDYFQPDKGGKWNIVASWQGDKTHFGSSSEVESIFVQKIPTSLVCSTKIKEITIGETIMITGKISPPISKMINLDFKRPDGSKSTLQVKASSNGTFNINYVPDLVGSWTIKARFAGDDLYNPSESAVVVFIVKNTFLGMIFSWIMENLIISIIIVAATITSLTIIFITRRRKKAVTTKGEEEWEYLAES